ncbi:UNVERIFIED_CONTAM: hypothetical protein NCL1_54472 [Trichonephila clavipes]
MLSLNECPFAVLVCKFQPSLPVNSNKHRCMNQTSAVREQPEQRSLNSSLEDTVGNPLIPLGEMLPPLVWKPMIRPFWNRDKSLLFCIMPTIAMFSETLTYPLFSLNFAMLSPPSVIGYLTSKLCKNN